MTRIFILFLALIFLVAGFFLLPQDEKLDAPPILSPKQAPQKAVLSEKTPNIPTRIAIAKLGISANLESVGMNEKGAMDVPKDPMQAAWYNLGYRPGSAGSAVIAGHVDKPTGAPAVFANLKSLQPGDEISITDEENVSYQFFVTSVVSYEHDEVPLQAIFDDRTGKKLNLITCDGTWDTTSQNYSNRVVVYAQMKE